MNDNEVDVLVEEELEEEEIQEGYESSSSPSTTTSSLTWITWFCSLPGHEYFCEVAEEFIEDDFNLTGLSALVPFYNQAMEMILDVEAEEDSHKIPDVSIVESSAELLYGLIHRRFIITRQGLQQMYAKYDASHFGVCPRVYCTSGKLVPCGRSDLPGVDTVKLYCPSCVDMYVPPSSRFSGVDGSFFGTTFPHLLFQTYPSALPFPTVTQPITGPKTAVGPRTPTTPLTSISKLYIPRIYGFRVSERARSGPRMQWLRMRPAEGELEWSEQSGTLAHQRQESILHQEGIFDESKDDEDEDDEEDQEEEEEESSAMKMSGLVATPEPVNTTTERGRANVGPATASLMKERVYRPLPAPRSSPSSAPTAPTPAAMTTNPSNTNLPRKPSASSLTATKAAQVALESKVVGTETAKAGAVRAVKTKPKANDLDVE